jgi:hypothetical protein
MLNVVNSIDNPKQSPCLIPTTLSRHIQASKNYPPKMIAKIVQDFHPLRTIAPPTVLSEPVIHPQHEEIDQEVISYLVNTWEWPSERVKKGFVSWKLSEVVLFMFPTGEVTRVKLACELLLLGFLMDGAAPFPDPLTKGHDPTDFGALTQTGSIITRSRRTLPSFHVFPPFSTIPQHLPQQQTSSACTQLSSLVYSL